MVGSGALNHRHTGAGRAFQRACITGGAGFVGSHLAELLSNEGVDVVIIDDFRHGRHEFIARSLEHPRVELIEGDVLDDSVLARAFAGCDWVFHLQANADVRRGFEHPSRDLEQNTIATWRVLETMRQVGVKQIVFASTGSVYGEPAVFPTPERAPFPLQTSLYGASKLAGEGLVSAYASGYGFTSVICRYVSLLGERYTHGHLFDFYRALRRDPERLLVQGNGHQAKSYLYVRDCVQATTMAARCHHGEPGAHVYNVGTDETSTVDDSIAAITEHLSISPRIEYTGGQRGWVGDSPVVHLDIARILTLGWRPTLTIGDAVVRTLQWFDTNEYAWRDDAVEDEDEDDHTCPSVTESRA
jgi:UDP-glucose 4-epimerase